MPRLNMVQSFRSSLAPIVALTVGLSGAGFLAMRSGGDPVLGTEPISIGTPKREKPLDYVSGSPVLTAGFQDWALCELGSRVETRPPLLGMHRWGPAALLGGGGGCGPCGGGAGGSFSGDPRSAALGLQLFPPHDIPMGDIGELPPSPTDHAFVMAGTGEVVYQEVDFVIPGIGFDLYWARTYRSAYDFEGWNGYGWSHPGENVLVEHANGNVSAYLWGRAQDQYTWNSGSSTWTSPDGYWDQLTKGTRGSGHTPSEYANEPYFIKTDKTGVVWEFDRAVDTPKSVYVCTSITDPWGNSMEFLYNTTDPYQLDKVTDTEGREVTFTYSSGLMTQLTVSNSSIHADYGNVTIDYEYSGNLLTKATKHKTRQADGGTVVRPYTEYTYISGGVPDKNLNLVKDCTVTVLDFDYTTYGSARDRCTQVTDADGEVHTYSHENGSSPTYSRYTDPSGQYRDFEHADSANGDYFILKVKEYLEDEDGDDLGGSYDLTITRDCDCGRITDLAYPDGSTEEWTYDSNGNVTKYVRTSAGAEADLVKAWTYDTFGNHCRMLTSSGWLRQEATPGAKVTWAYDGGGKLNTVTWPSVTSGQPSSQTIQWEYEFNSNGSLYWTDDPDDDRTEYGYTGNDVLVIQDPAGLGREFETVKDVMGHATSSVDASGNTTSTVTVAPDGRVLKVAGANSQESKYEYDLRGRRTKSSLLLTGTTWTHTTYTVSAGGVVTQTKADDGGLNAISTFAVEEGSSNRYTQSLDPDEFGSRSKWGYGSYGLPWITYHVDDSGMSTVTTQTQKLVRNTMGRVTTSIALGGTETDYVYDGFGRLTETHTDLPSSKVRKTIRTLTAWGADSVVEVKESTTLLAKTTNYYDEAVRLWKSEQDDPESVLSDLVTTYLLDKSGRVSERTDPRGGVWETQWDAAHRVTKTIDPIGNEIQYAYSDVNQTRTITSREYNTATSSFTNYVVVETMDDSGRVVTSKNEGSASGNRTTSFVYDLANRRTQVTTPLGWDTDSVYDALGRMTSQTEEIDGTPTTATTTYTYSLGGRRTQVTDANGIVTRWTYDAFGRELTVTYDYGGSDPQTTTRTYDSYGRLATITEPMGNVQTMTYDVAGRRTQVDINKASSGLGGPDRLLFTYDDMNRVLTGKTQVNSGGYSDVTSVTRAYDGFGRMDSETQDGSFALAYVYDEGGAVKEITYPSGSVIVGVRYTLDDLGRPTTIERKLSTAVEGIGTSAWETAATVKYHGHREVERVQSPYDLKRTQSWTNFKEPDTLEYKENSSPFALLTGLESMWNADGQMVVRTRLHDEDTYEFGEVFRYDRMGRLTKMWYDVRNPSGFSSTDPEEGTNPYDLRKTWNLGKVFERDSVVVKEYNQTAGTTAYTINDHYQVTAGPASMTWNDNGYLTDRGADDFGWTALGQLEQAAISGGDTLNYTYDAFGRRVKTVNDSQVNRFVYHGWHMIGEWDDTADEWLWQEAPWSSGERMLEHIGLDTNDVDDDTNTSEYRQYAVHEDFQDTVWGLSDTSAAIAERYNYTDPYGLSDSEDGSAGSLGEFGTQVFHQKRMHGGFVELESELYDFRNRWLLVGTGLWCSRDPMGHADSVNAYQVLLANPLVATDQLGLRVESWAKWEKERQKELLGKDYGHLILAAIYARGCMIDVKDDIESGKCDIDRRAQNDILHCALMCSLARAIDDPDKAREAGLIHEIADIGEARRKGRDVGKTRKDSRGDLHANEKGLELSARRGESCCCLCREAYGCPCEESPRNEARIDPVGGAREGAVINR